MCVFGGKQAANAREVSPVKPLFWWSANITKGKPGFVSIKVVERIGHSIKSVEPMFRPFVESKQGEADELGDE